MDGIMGERCSSSRGRLAGCEIELAIRPREAVDQKLALVFAQTKPELAWREQMEGQKGLLLGGGVRLRPCGGAHRILAGEHAIGHQPGAEVHAAHAEWLSRVQLHGSRRAVGRESQPAAEGGAVEEQEQGRQGQHAQAAAIRQGDHTVRPWACTI